MEKYWISVKEKLPGFEDDNLYDPLDDVLISYMRVCPTCCNEEGSYISIGYYNEVKWRLSEPLSNDIFDEEIHSQIEVTHWMYLPEKPNNIKESSE